MKSYKNLSLLLLGLLIYGCNEKISPELEAGLANAGGGGTPTPTPTSYSFGITNGNLVARGFNLHKTGAGNWNKSCEISTTTPMSSEAYIADPSTYDVTCFMEAEELALYMSGVSFNVNASPDSCEYVAYSPYSFFQYMPGDSSSDITLVECDETVDNTLAGAYGPTPTFGAGMTKLGCGQIVDESLPHASRQVRAFPSDPAFLCNYDYSRTGGPNCDTGTINVRTLSLTVPDPVAFPGVVGHTTTLTSISCAGQIAECVAGPIKQVSGSEGHTRFTEITPINSGEAYTNLIEVPNLIDNQRRSSVEIANFRRHMANKDINYVTSIDPTAVAYRNAFSDPLFNQIFEPDLMNRFSSNLNMAPIPGRIHDVTPATLGAYSLGQYAIDYSLAAGYTTRPLAADPHLGIGSVNQVNPFYTFYCLDSAWEIKGRIRMMVREWDRSFTPSTALDFISDIQFHTFTPPYLSRQDVFDVPEVPYDPDGYNGYNDVRDWDDLLIMTRTSGAFAGAGTEWIPASGWFDPSNFPQDNM